MTDILRPEISSSYHIRDELEAMVMKDLVGPAGGPEEIVAEPTVRGRYILGILAPKGQTVLLTEEEDLDDQTELPTAGEDTQDGSPDVAAAKAPSMLPSSIGLTFTVGGEANEIQITARWGRYVRVESETETTQSGKPRRVWQRIPVEATSIPIPLITGKFEAWSPDPENDEVAVRGLIRHHDDHWTITVYLTNEQTEPKQNKDSVWVFQPELIIEAPDQAPIFLKRAQRRDPAKISLEEQAMQMVYRHQVEFAVGHGVAVQADLPEGGRDRAIRLTTRVMPTYEVPKITPPTPADIPELANVVLDMKTLSETADADFAQAIGPLVSVYEQWIQTQAGRAANPPDDLKPYIQPAQDALKKANKTLDRIRAGLALLGSDAQAAEAFRFANRAMWQQRIHTLYAQQRRQGEKVTLEQFDVPQNRRWYPFQLAFILLNLPSVTDIHHQDRSEPTKAIADLLWFPTGGGKTEAYLGLTAFTLGLRRLQGIVDGYSGNAGVAVLMRYTLRLLTLQQFQRATALICACESIRREALAQGDARWGVEPFRIGLWVGARSTPNRTEESAEAIKRDRGQFQGTFGSGTPYQLTYCPWCGSDIGQGRDLVVETYSRGRGRTLMYCGGSLGRCLFSRKKSPDEGLPAVVVDEEIYRRLPALLIATVDKFAQMPWKGETQMLFGRVNGYCERHGYRSPEIEDTDTHRAVGKFPKAVTKPTGPLRPPDLIIQDELHLISGPLGTLVGLYESAIDYLCSWEAHGQRVRPKVIASTATIRRADSQVNHLYLRQVNIFPPAGLDIEDNFFSRQRPPGEENPGRRYVGICAPGTRLKTVLIRVYVAYMAAAQQLYEKYGGQLVDPYLTTVGYFNSVRELGGMRRAVDDAVRTRLRKADERGLSKRFIEHYGVEELTSRKGASDIPLILDRLETSFPAQAGGKRKQAGQEYPLDVLLATNMISVGVDVSRLGLMVVAGQPKTTAEYIQATSRVGRRFPGLVCVVYNWTRPRDLSHYERFEHYHATFYQHVEPLSVTPFSPRARNRGLSGVLVSYIRLSAEEFNDNLGAGRISASHPLVQAALNDISWRAGMIEGKAAIETEVKKELEERLDQWLAQAQRPAPAQLGYKQAHDSVTLPLLFAPEERDWDDFTCLNSLRDVEPSVGLILDNYGMDQAAPPVSHSVTGSEDSDE